MAVFPLWAKLGGAACGLHHPCMLQQAGKREEANEAKEQQLGQSRDCCVGEILRQTLHCQCVQIGREFSERLASAHDTGCPWSTSACDPSLAQFPPLDRSVVAADFAAREEAVGRLNVLPPIAEDAYARINAVRRSADVLKPIPCSHERCTQVWECPEARLYVESLPCIR